MTTAVVVDASAVIDALLPTPRRRRVLTELRVDELWAPSILDLEVISALARLERTGQISTAEAERAIADLRTAPIRRIEAGALTDLAWSMRTSVRISDGFYVAAARLLEARLLTCDARLGRAPLGDVTVTVVR